MYYYAAGNYSTVYSCRYSFVVFFVLVVVSSSFDVVTSSMNGQYLSFA